YELVTIHDKIFAAALSLNLSYLVFQVYPFTVLGKKELLRLKTESPEQQLGLFIGNVYQYNIKMLRSI
ncbi:MAG: hypothetical protein Q7U83_17890, partial [Daejeonella sp.]|nr:hypothetical protein [Daejeonella sp.]